MNDRVRFVPNDHAADDLALKAVLEAMAEGCKVEGAVIAKWNEDTEE